MKRGSTQTSAAKGRIREARRAIVERNRRRYSHELVVWKKQGAVGEQLRPFFNARADQRLSIVEALGGELEMAPQELVVVGQWLQSQVIADALFGLIAAEAGVTSRLVEKFVSATNTARAALALLGLKRRFVEALDVEFSEERLAAAAAAAGRTVDELLGRDPAPTDERGADASAQSEGER